MKINKIISRLLLLAVFAVVVAGCKDDDISVDTEMGKTYEAPQPGAPGSLQQKIYEFYERWGTYVFYDFDELDMRYVWNNSKWNNEYTPVQDGFEQYAIRMLEYIEDMFAVYTNDFVRPNFVYRIFLVDNFKNETGTATQDIFLKGNDYVIGNIGASMDGMKTAQWNAIQSTIVGEFTRKYYDSNPIKPTAFFNLRITMDENVAFDNLVPGGVQDDPLGEYYDLDPTGYYGDNYAARYTYMLGGFIEPIFLAFTWSMYRTPTLAKDYADFTSFLITKPAAQIKRIFERSDFQLLQQRILALVTYLDDVVDMNVIATQNKNCPEDPLPAGYFDQF